MVSEGKWSLEKRAMEYLVTKHDLNADRLKYVERKKMAAPNVKLFLVPQGATPPN
jgi:hypothetical protein